MSTYTTFVGTYTDGESEGIYRATMDTDAGTLDDVSLAARVDDPSFLTLGPNGRYLYAVNEVDGGALTAFRVEGNELTEVAHREIGPADPCHVDVDGTGEYAFVAHYTGGAVSMIPIQSDGGLGEPTVVEHHGSSVDPERQDGPHPHSANVGPNGDLLYVPDLGTDELVVYEIDRTNGTLVRVEGIAVHDGAGPRHLAFDGDAGRAYLINELDSTLTAFDWIPANGTLERPRTVSTLDGDSDGENYPADVHVHPNGRYVYGSNRGEDSIAMFDVAEDTPELIGTATSGGEWPRNFVLSPDGGTLFVANQFTHNVVGYPIDPGTGTLGDAIDETELPAPVCLVPLTTE